MQSGRSTGQRGRDRKPNEARWKREQTKDLLKAAEDARDKNRTAKAGERAHIQRHLCVFR